MNRKANLFVTLLLALLVSGGLTAGPTEEIENVPAEDPCVSSGPNVFCNGSGSGGSSTCYACEITTVNGVVTGVSCESNSSGRTSCTATVENGVATCSVTGGSC